MINVQALVDAHLYPTTEAAMEDALRALLRDKPQLRIELAIYRYRNEDISLAQAAHLAGVSFDRMKALLVEHNIQPRLGPADISEAQSEVAEMQRIAANRNPS
jgi:predicted HTH domain antitoxin